MMMMFGGRLSMGELVLIAGVALLVFGPKKLPEFGRSIGESIRAFKESFQDGKE